MNEKKFLKKIKSKRNEDGDLTYLEVCDLLEENHKVPALNKPIKGFQKIFSKFRKEKSPDQILMDNFETVLQKTNEFYMIPLIEKLIQNEKINPQLLENFHFILNRMNQPDFWARDIASIYRSFKRVKGFEQYIEENIVSIIQNTHGEKLFETTRNLKGTSEKIDTKLNEALENNKLSVAKYILSIATRNEGGKYKETSEEILNKYSEDLALLIDKTLQQEHLKMIDINGLPGGGYTNVFQIGNKILKMGAPREVNEVPNLPDLILQPILKTEYFDSKNEPFACIELTTKAERLTNEDCQEEKLYEIYKNLREKGYIWTDAKFPNLGKIDGRLVIIDLDFIYHESRKDIKWPTINSERFEKRYLQEKTAQISEDFLMKHKTQVTSLEEKINQRGE